MTKLIITLICLLSFLSAKDYSKNPQVKEFIHTLVVKDRYSKKQLNRLFSNVEIQLTPLKIFSPKKKIKRTRQQMAILRKLYPKYGAWDRYIKYKITPKRVDDGVAFLKKYKTTFDRVEKRYGVPKEYICAIIGVESVYGKNVGKYKVFDTLTTLSFEKNRRSRFFKKELRAFLNLSRRERFNPKNVYGSFAGAIGLGQFMPSNYQAYGVDFDKNGRVSMQTPADAIASIAKYLYKNRWKKGELVAVRANYNGNRFRAYKTGYNRLYFQNQLKNISPKEPWNYTKKVRLIKLNRKDYDELWFGAKNFFVITRYNHSAYYAMTIHQLATLLATRLKEEAI